MVVAFTFVFWGTGSLTCQKAFEISGSSLTTLGFSKPDGTGRIWLAFMRPRSASGWSRSSSATCPPSTPPTTGARRGSSGCAPSPARRPAATELPPDPAPHGRPRHPRLLAEQADWMLDLEQTHTAFPILSYFPETARRPLLGRHRRDPARCRRARHLGVGDASGRVFEDVEKGPLWSSSTGCRPSCASPGPPTSRCPSRERLAELTAHFGEPAAADQHRPRRVPRGHGGHGARPRSSSRATRRRRGAGSPGSARPTTRRCGPGRPHRRRSPRRGRRTGRPTSAGRASCAGARCTWTGRTAPWRGGTGLLTPPTGG